MSFVPNFMCEISDMYSWLSRSNTARGYSLANSRRTIFFALLWGLENKRSGGQCSISLHWLVLCSFCSLTYSGVYYNQPSNYISPPCQSMDTTVFGEGLNVVHWNEASEHICEINNWKDFSFTLLAKLGPLVVPGSVVRNHCYNRWLNKCAIKNYR